jgi:hypothetical protein
MPGITYANGGAICVFNGQQIGFLRSFDIDAGAVRLEDATHGDSFVTGTGTSSRVVRQWDCTSVDPVTITVEFFGEPPAYLYDRGAQGQLTLAVAGKTIVADAILVSHRYTGRVGELTAGTATFTLTGNANDLIEVSK